MSIDIVTLISSVVAGSLSGLGAGRFAAGALKERWMEKVKAEYARELEASKAEYASQLEGLKDTLGRGSYVTKAQFDIELNAYKELWSSVSDVRNTARSLLAQEKFVMVAEQKDEMEYRIEAFSKSMKAFHAAHNTAILTTERFAPFYPHNVKEACRKITASDMNIVNFYAAIGPETFSKTWFSDLEDRINTVCDLVDRLEHLIRERLTAVRILQ